MTTVHWIAGQEWSAEGILDALRADYLFRHPEVRGVSDLRLIEDAATTRSCEPEDKQPDIRHDLSLLMSGESVPKYVENLVHALVATRG